MEFTAAMHQLVKALWYIDSVEEKLTEILKRIAHFYQADRAHIIEVDWDLYIGNVIYEYCALGVEPKKDELHEIDLSKLLRWHQATKQQKAICIEDIAKIRDSEPAEYEFLKEQGVVALLGLPLYEKLPGYLVLTNPKRYATETVMMNVGAYMIAGSFVRQKLQKTVESKSRNYPKLAADEIEIDFFGGLEVTTSLGALNEETIKSQLSVKLIAYLCLARQRRNCAQEVSDAVWSEQLPANPGKQLGNVVSSTKKVFNCICEYPIIEHEGNIYELNKAYHVVTDLDRFINLCTKAKVENDLQKKMEVYHTAFELYKGPVLPSFDDVEWIRTRAVVYRMMYVEAVTFCLKEMCLESMFFDACRLAEQALIYEPNNAEILYFLMKAHIKLGGKNAVKQQYCRVGQYLSEEQCKDIEEELNL